MQTRVLSFSGIHNFRDYGGYHGRDGARVKAGRLYRSGQHLDADQDDLVRVAALGLSTVVDLRGKSERAAHPCPRPGGFEALVLFADGETAGSVTAPHVEAARQVSTADDAHRAMVNLYQQMPFRPYLVEIFRAYFKALAERDGPSLVHCLAGKDRTGLIVALLHDMLGVHRDDIMADYLLTNTAGNIDARIAAGATTVRANFGHDMSDDAVRTLMSVDATYLNAGFESILVKHGSLAAYRRAVLDVSSEQEAQILAALLD